MYCHAMATLALCEAYALTGDDRLRDPVERAVAFLVRARARDGMAWRYAPGAPVGDTSILGWVVMGLKSAKEVGIPIPDEPAVRRGTLLWLDKVATGQSKGLARYQPWEPVTPTMTAEAWVCRQFLGVGGPGPASSEAAEFSAPERIGSRTDQRLLLVLRHAGALPARRRTLVEVECQDPRQDRRPSVQRRAIRRGAGSPTRASTEPREAGSTARPWRPCRSRSTTATCGSMTNPRSRSKRA